MVVNLCLGSVERVGADCGWFEARTETHSSLPYDCDTRVGETNIKSSDPNSEPQGITNYDFELPCKISDHSDQFGLGPHPPLWERE